MLIRYKNKKQRKMKRKNKNEEKIYCLINYLVEELNYIVINT